jgi:hypothetical protein
LSDPLNRLHSPHRLYGLVAAFLWLSAQFIEHDLGLVLVFLPVALLFFVLLLGRRPGEALLTRLRERWHRPQRRVGPLVRAGNPSERRRVSGGTLLARRLAGRAPPRLFLTTA